ncbi:hypothetical protein Agub_g6526 [Astrephomene gubernaculifera]|uniref:FAD-binding domain-containing protein n=1 Tax=Astrephomene gubernaculifera TaxID=47775 RepID=A0AAD3DNK3_9CHLO|nr:hypothetical protein Agub_g6526 [Astrephomene gubernaculifera]
MCLSTLKETQCRRPDSRTERNVLRTGLKCCAHRARLLCQGHGAEGAALPARISFGRALGLVAKHPHNMPRGRVVAGTFADPVMDAPEVDDEVEGTRWNPANLTALVVGAGPTGALAAHYLAMRGYGVVVVDKGPRPAPWDAASVPLVLSSRGAIAFEELGLDQQRRVGPSAPSPLRGVWDAAAGRLRQQVDDSSAFRHAFVTDRSGLASDLIDAAEQRYPDRVRFHFNTELVRAELKNRIAVLRTTHEAGAAAAAAPASPASQQGEAGPAGQALDSAQEQEVYYDLMVGADGVESTVRGILKAKVKDFSVIRPVEEEMGCLPVSRLPPPAQEPLPGFSTSHKPQEYLYEWSAPGRPMVRIFKDHEGVIGGTVTGLSTTTSTEAVRDELLAAYGNFPPEWAAEIGRQVCSPACPAARRACILQCNQFWGPRAVLLGDAAHAVTGASRPVGLPAGAAGGGVGVGQGPSAAIESVRTLALVLRGAQDDLDKVPEVFSRVRGDAVMAMQMLEFMELTRGGSAARALKFQSLWFAWSALLTRFFRFLSEATGRLLAALLPSQFISAEKVVSRLDDRRIGYSEVIKMMQGYATPVVALVLGGAFVGLLMAYNRMLG